jgi:hypothetical protein
MMRGEEEGKIRLSIGFKDVMIEGIKLKEVLGEEIWIDESVVRQVQSVLDQFHVSDDFIDHYALLAKTPMIWQEQSQIVATFSSI